MKRLLAVPVLLAFAVGLAFAQKFEDKQLGISLTAPDGFVAGPNEGKKDGFIGEPKAIYLSPDAQSNGGLLMIHHMDLPGGADYATFKGAFVEGLKTAFGGDFKLVKQEDLKVDKLTGFLLEFECPGDGSKPMPGGSIPHHVRWYLIKQGDKKLVGLIFMGRQAAWNDLGPKYAASAQTLKAAEN